MNRIVIKIIIYCAAFTICTISILLLLIIFFDIDISQVFLTIKSVSSYKSIFKYSTPLLLCSLAVSIAGRAGLLNIGLEGQVYLGGFIAGIVGYNYNIFYEKFQITHLFFYVIISTTIPGMICASCGFLKSKFKIHEVPTTLFSYLFIYALVNYLINFRCFSEPIYGPQTRPIKSFLYVPNYFAINPIMNDIIAFLIGILCLFITWLIIEKTIFGVRLKGLGENPEAFKNLGYKFNFYYIIIMFFSGVIASFVGILRVSFQDGRFIENFSPGYGFIGLIIAFAGNYMFFDLLIISLGLAQLQCFVGKWAHLTNLPVEFLEFTQVIFIIYIVLLRKLLERYFNES